jgi:predicted phage-related endonuclease
MIERRPMSAGYDWLAERLQYINGSEIGTVCGEASYGSLAELYAEKKGLRPPMIDSGVLRRGRWGEAAVFQALHEERPHWQIQRARVHVVDTSRRLACTPDGFATAPDRDGIGVIQAKVISRSVFRQRWLDVQDDDVATGEATPQPAYVLQTLMEMVLNECPWGVLVVLISGEFDWRLRTFEVARDAIIENVILERAAAFWREHLDPGIMPPFEPQRDAALVRLLYPKDDGTEIDLTTDNRVLSLVDEWVQVGNERKRLEKAEGAIKTQLQAKLGVHTFGRLQDGRRLSWKSQHRKGHTVAPSDFRVLRLLKATED